MTVILTQSPEAAAEIRKELDRGERLIWSGAPRQGLRLRPSDALFIPFSLMWGGFAIFWEATVLGLFVPSAGRSGQAAPLFMALWGVPFVLAGLYITVGRFFLDAAQRARTFYGVTDSRAIIVSGLTGRSVKSLSLRTLPEITFSERGDGSGSIVFGTTAPYATLWQGTSWPGMAQRLAPSFEMIEDARRVYGIVKDAQREAR